MRVNFNDADVISQRKKQQKKILNKIPLRLNRTKIASCGCAEARREQFYDILLRNSNREITIRPKTEASHQWCIT